jgi:transcription elongation factor SPT5
MVDILKVPNKEFALSKGGWVRMKRGPYKGDLAQVVGADEARGRVTIKLIPRLDLVYASSSTLTPVSPR